MAATLRRSARASHHSGLSCCGARALGAQASEVVGHRLSSCGLWALEHGLSSCGTRAYLLRRTWDLPGPGLEPVSPALAGGFLTTAPPGKSQCMLFLSSLSFLHLFLLIKLSRFGVIFSCFFTILVTINWMPHNFMFFEWCIQEHLCGDLWSFPYVSPSSLVSAYIL